MNIREAIKKIIAQKDLSEQEAFEVAMEMMRGQTTDAQIASLLTGLRMKDVTTDEITGFVKAMRQMATPIECKSRDLVDTCGTGGDGSGTFNISTISAFVAAGAGCKVAKHGNRSVSSKCGSADLLKALGVNIEIEPDRVATCLDEVGIGFLFAPNLHKAMKYATGPRREIGVRTIFNILGPLTNPAGAKRQVLGVFSEELTDRIASVLKNLGAEHCMILHGEDGLDEITITGKTFITELIEGEIKSYHIEPEDFGIENGTMKDIRGGDVDENVKIALNILQGEKGPKREIVIINAGAAIYIAGKADSFLDGIELAKESIDSGKAANKLRLLKEMSQ